MAGMTVTTGAAMTTGTGAVPVVDPVPIFARVIVALAGRTARMY